MTVRFLPGFPAPWYVVAGYYPLNLDPTIDRTKFKKKKVQPTVKSSEEGVASSSRARDLGSAFDKARKAKQTADKARPNNGGARKRAR